MTGRSDDSVVDARQHRVSAPKDDTGVAATRPDRRRSPIDGRRRLGAALSCSLPWTWFAVRDAVPLFDVVAIAMPVLVACAVFAALAYAAVRRRARPVIFALSTATVGAVAILGPWIPRPMDPPSRAFRFVAANAFRNNASPEQAARDILDQHADVVAMVEGGEPLLPWLQPHFPFAAARPGGEPILLSRFPLRALPFPVGLKAASDVTRWSLTTPVGDVVLYAIHLDRPTVRDNTLLVRLDIQRKILRVVLNSVRTERLPTLVAGDFNLSDRSWGYRRLSEVLTDAMRERWAGPTYVNRQYLPLLLRIDNIFISRHWCADHTGRFDIHGSDHRGVVADLGPCPGQPATRAHAVAASGQAGGRSLDE